MQIGLVSCSGGRSSAAHHFGLEERRRLLTTCLVRRALAAVCQLAAAYSDCRSSCAGLEPFEYRSAHRPASPPPSSYSPLLLLRLVLVLAHQPSSTAALCFAKGTVLRLCLLARLLNPMPTTLVATSGWWRAASALIGGLLFGEPASAAATLAAQAEATDGRAEAEKARQKTPRRAKHNATHFRAPRLTLSPLFSFCACPCRAIVSMRGVRCPLLACVAARSVCAACASYSPTCSLCRSGLRARATTTHLLNSSSRALRAAQPRNLAHTAKRLFPPRAPTLAKGATGERKRRPSRRAN